MTFRLDESFCLNQARLNYRQHFFSSAFLSSNINEGIKVVFIFKRKDSTRTKRI